MNKFSSSNQSLILNSIIHKIIWDDEIPISIYIIKKNFRSKNVFNGPIFPSKLFCKENFLKIFVNKCDKLSYY